MPAILALESRAPPGNGEAKAMPVVFGGCAGWLHLPAPARALGRGVVLCTPFGYEGVSASRPMRDWALHMADAGLSVLRFDYPGTGESAGDAEVPPPVATCVAAAVEAASFLLRHAAIQEVAFAGCRFGALIAALAAREQPGGAASLALLAPVLSGRAYARELRLLAYGAAEGEPGESAGFPITPEFLAELATHDLNRLSRPPAGRIILLADPDRIAPATALARAWAEKGAEAVAEPFDGMARLLAEAHGVEAPVAAFDAARRILAAAAPDAREGQPADPPEAVLHLPNGITERVVRFGPGESLVGTWTLPRGGVRQGMPALLIPGTGANRRIGNGRISVPLARRAARLGIPALRYDATGVGDSDNPRGIPLVRLMYSRQAIEDARHALDWLASQGHPRAMAVGSCAGAYVALHLAIADPRVILVVAGNLQRFIWREGRVLTVPATRASRTDAERLQWQALRDALRARARPIDLLRAVLPPHVKHAWKRGVVRKVASLAWALPRGWVGSLEAGKARLGMERLASRGTRVLFVYCSDDTGLDEFEAHLGRGGHRLARLPGFGRAVIPGGDHTLSTAAMRAHFLSIVLPELEAAAGAAGTGSGAEG